MSNFVVLDVYKPRVCFEVRPTIFLDERELHFHR
jgi:hypothetical protein